MLKLFFTTDYLNWQSQVNLKQEKEAEGKEKKMEKVGRGEKAKGTEKGGEEGKGQASGGRKSQQYCNP